MHGFGVVLEGAGVGEVAGLVEGVGACVGGVGDDVVLGDVHGAHFLVDGFDKLFADALSAGLRGYGRSLTFK